MLLWAVAHTAVPSDFTELGLKPPWNHPHVTFFAFNRSPMFLPDIEMYVLGGARVQSSSDGSGRGSPITEPDETLPAALPAVTVAPCVCPAIRFSAPGVDGPNTVPKELSLMA